MFVYPHAFFSAILQNYARQTNTSVELYELSFSFSENEPADRASTGEYISGIVIEQAKLNANTIELEDSDGGLPISQLP